MMTELTNFGFRLSERYDPIFEAGVDVANVAYAAASDRIYDVQGRKGICMVLKNVSASGDLTYKIDKSVKHFSALADLTEPDWLPFVAEATLAKDAIKEETLIRVTPNVTAIRIRMKNASGATTPKMTGAFSTL